MRVLSVRCSSSRHRRNRRVRAGHLSSGEFGAFMRLGETVEAQLEALQGGCVLTESQLTAELTADAASHPRGRPMESVTHWDALMAERTAARRELRAIQMERKTTLAQLESGSDSLKPATRMHGAPLLPGSCSVLAPPHPRSATRRQKEVEAHTTGDGSAGGAAGGAADGGRDQRFARSSDATERRPAPLSSSCMSLDLLQNPLSAVRHEARHKALVALRLQCAQLEAALS